MQEFWIEKVENYWNETYMNQIMKQLNSLYPTASFDTSILWEQLLSGHIFQALEEVLKGIQKSVYTELLQNKSVLFTILLLGILAASLTILSDLLEKQELAEIGFYLIYAVLVSFLGQVFLQMYQLTKSLLSQIILFVQLLLPAFTTAIVMSNGVTSATVYHQGIIIIIYCVESVLGKWVLPFVKAFCLLAILDSAWAGNRFKNMIQLLEKSIRTILKMIVLIIGGVGILQSMITPVIDSVRWNAVTNIGSLIPGIGNLSKSSLQIVIGTAVLIRNGIGVFFTLMLFLICFAPICKLFIMASMIKLSSALVSVANHNRLTIFQDRIGDSIFLLLKIALTGIEFFLIVIAILALTVNRNG